ncbi:MAG TPA: cation diffusion facilitator family transporter [Micromonosporaceae bacterium]
MAGEEGTKAVVIALTANLTIAVAKFVAAAITGSASMAAEGVHSVADSTNQALLLIGGKRAKREATETHQFGYGRERYVYAFIVSIVLFAVGGLYALYEGYHKLSHPEKLTSPLVAIGVLVFAIVLESYALIAAIRLANHSRRSGWFHFVRHAKAPELPTILLEDAAAVTGLILALLGVGLTWWTGNGRFDGAATLGIGIVLGVVAVFLAIEMKSLLIGESAVPADVDSIRTALTADPVVDSVNHLRTMHLGPEELLVTANIAVREGASAEEIGAAIDGAEERIRSAVPIATVIYIEPDTQALPTAL